MPHETRDLTDTVVLVTGAGSGIGRATATALLESGARVVLADIDLEAATGVAAAWSEDRAIACRTDIRRPADAHAAVALAVETWGRLDSVVCNAGIGAFAASWTTAMNVSRPSWTPTWVAPSGSSVPPRPTTTPGPVAAMW